MLVEYNVKHSIYFYFNEELDFLILSKRARLRYKYGPKLSRLYSFQV